MRRRFSLTNNAGEWRALSRAPQSENTRKNYASQFGKFRSWCEQGDYAPLLVQPEVLTAYAVELADDEKSMSTVRLAVAAIVDAHRRVGLAIRMIRRGAPVQAVQTNGRWNSPSMPARYTRSEKALEALEWLV